MDRRAFREKMNLYLRPSNPIKTEELLKGRARQMEKIDSIFDIGGRHVFIFGPRGVGKTSLAQTAAHTIQSVDADPIFVSCDASTTLYGLCKDIAVRLYEQDPRLAKETHGLEKSGALTLIKNRFGYKQTDQIELSSIPVPSSINEAAQLLDHAVSQHSADSVVVIDELERMDNECDRKLLGDLVKQIGDREIPLKFIFTGIADALIDLFTAHESAYRYVSGVELDRLDISDSMEILQFAADKLGVLISRDHKIRAAQISDGFPHYTHLLGWKIFYASYIRSPGSFQHKITPDDFEKGINIAVGEMEGYLKQAYVKATQKHSDDYVYILWAFAASPTLQRQLSEVFKVYQEICEECGQPASTKPQFSNKLGNLKDDRHGKILIPANGGKNGWYEFREPIMRGYCRLQAAKRGVILGPEYFER